MYSNKDNVNLLTAQLAAYGVRHAVICPGSRNTPISHNFSVHHDIHCHSVVDERSAGFYALGLCQATKSAVVVCVTSGSALMNVSPAVVEAYYQHLPLIVVSADRTQQWIGQQDGQTMEQYGVLNNFVRKSVNIIEPVDDEQRWYCRRMVSEAIIEATKGCGGPVHINIPISEPLFDFSEKNLPAAQPISFIEPSLTATDIQPFLVQMKQSERPMIVFGQTSNETLSAADIATIAEKMVVLSEPLCSIYENRCNFDAAIASLTHFDDYQPDFVLYVGDGIVSKHLKRFLRSNSGVIEWICNPDGTLYDTFCHLAGIIKTHPSDVLATIAQQIATDSEWKADVDYYNRWQLLLETTDKCLATENFTYSEASIVRQFERTISSLNGRCFVHYANSLAVRNACKYAAHHVYCNRGVNGIEGSLSTVCGFSLATTDMVYCVIGDLSFFYDSNALWQKELKGNLRILLINNSGGGIFDNLLDLSATPAGKAIVAAEHKTTAKGVCEQNDIVYLTATTQQELDFQLQTLTQSTSDRPILLEAFV